MPDLTLATLRTALARAHGPAVERLTDRTPEGIAAAYLPRVIWTEREPAETGWAGAVWSDQIDMLGRHKTVGALRLDLTDPGTVHAVLVALCLALGYDCGPMGLYVVFVRRGTNWAMIVDESPGVRVTHHFHHISEPDPVRALCLALQWAIERTP